jgi:hypothetical protein
MPRALLIARLEIVEGQIALAQANIEAQRRVIEGMRQKGFATGDAETYLTILQTSLTVHLAERKRLRLELVALSTP